MTAPTCSAPGCTNPVPFHAQTGEPLKYCSRVCRNRVARAKQTPEQRESLKRRNLESKKRIREGRRAPKFCLICGAPVQPRTIVCERKECQLRRRRETRRAAKMTTVKPAPVAAKPSAVKPEKKGPGVANLKLGKGEKRIQDNIYWLCRAQDEDDYNPHSPEKTIIRLKMEASHA